MKRHHLAHQTFRDTRVLGAAIHDAVDELNRERRTDLPCDFMSEKAIHI
jgi:hypothetical protein